MVELGQCQSLAARDSKISIVVGKWMIYLIQVKAIQEYFFVVLFFQIMYVIPVSFP